MDGEEQQREFDWLKAMVDVDILKTEAVGEVVGRTTAAIFRGMIEAGIPNEQAHRIIQTAVREFFVAVLSKGDPGTER